MDPERDASDAIACFHIMREKPLPTWTWRELKEWTGVRRQRLRELRRARGLPPEARSVEVADIECERYVLQGRTSLWNLEVFVGPPDPRIEHVMRRGMLGGAKVVVPPDVLAREREELGVSRAPRRGVRGPPRREVGMSRRHGILQLLRKGMPDDDPHPEQGCRTRFPRAA